MAVTTTRCAHAGKRAAASDRDGLAITLSLSGLRNPVSLASLFVVPCVFPSPSGNVCMQLPRLHHLA